MNAQMQRPEDKPKSVTLKLWRLSVSLTWPWKQGWGIKREGLHFLHVRLGYVLMVVTIRTTLAAKRRRIAKMREKNPINFKQAS